MLDGWAPAEPLHRWTVGREASMWLPVFDPGPDCVLILDVAPWCDAERLTSQTVMLAINGRLLATFQLNSQRVMAFALPRGLSCESAPVLTISHLSCGLARPQAGLAETGLPLGLLFVSVRVMRGLPPVAPETRPALPGVLEDGTLSRAACQLTGLESGELVTRFENIGHNCQFGGVQRAFGAEPISLLRWTGTLTHRLADAFFARFAGLGTPEKTRVFVSDPPEGTYKIHDTIYHIWYNTGRKPDEATPERILRENCRRLAFLARKLIEDLREGHKIFVLARAEILSEPEALAIFCALNLDGRNTLLWAVHGDPARTGQVEQLRPGFLCGHLGAVNHHAYATLDAWISVLANAYLLCHEPLTA